MPVRAKKVDNSRKVAYNIPMLSERVTKLRMALGLTQKQLGEELNVSERTVQNIESGQHGRIQLIESRILEWLQAGETATRMEKEGLSQGGNGG